MVPSPEATVRQHHSFIKLPDAEYKPRVFDPRSGYFPIQYADYATPIGEPLIKRYITRHRLAKVDPSAPRSRAVEPIVYYVDRGAPQPIRSALVEGASWWQQAFEAAGYEDAFRVEILPEGVDPLDVRYHVIQWVHRSARGWSYGSSVIDPRTGEIIKGHVTLGSLRVRQDYLIVQGLIDAYEAGREPDPRMEEMALARLRQLAAHEVGHTLGLAHNYAASVNDRASVMDYPHPLITIDAGEPVFSQAYATGIGAWDKRAILYGYQDFATEEDDAAVLDRILQTTQSMGLYYLSDADARPTGSADPRAHLWDNGSNPVVELRRLLGVRAQALDSFDVRRIPVGAPLATLEEVLVPVYFMHRYQVEAAAKVIGGRRYSYAVRGDSSEAPVFCTPGEQQAAINALIQSLRPDALALPPAILALIPPRPPGYPRSRETFVNKTGFTLDPLGIAEAQVAATLALILDPQRANRLLEQHALDPQQIALHTYIDDLVVRLCRKVPGEEQFSPYEHNFNRIVQRRLIEALIDLSRSPQAHPQTAAVARAGLMRLAVFYKRKHERRDARRPINLYQAHFAHCLHRIETYLATPDRIEPIPAPALPDGAPIGMGCDRDHP